MQRFIISSYHTRSGGTASRDRASLEGLEAPLEGDNVLVNGEGDLGSELRRTDGGDPGLACSGSAARNAREGDGGRGGDSARRPDCSVGDERSAGTFLGLIGT